MVVALIVSPSRPCRALQQDLDDAADKALKSVNLFNLNVGNKQVSIRPSGPPLILRVAQAFVSFGARPWWFGALCGVY